MTTQSIGKTPLVIGVISAIALVSCSQGLQVRLYNNSKQPIGLSILSEQKEGKIHIDSMGEYKFLYKKVDEDLRLKIKTKQCIFEYLVTAPYKNYGNLLPSPLDEGPYLMTLQLEADFEIFFVPQGNELPAVKEALADQPAPFFPIRPIFSSCEQGPN